MITIYFLKISLYTPPSSLKKISKVYVLLIKLWEINNYYMVTFSFPHCHFCCWINKELEKCFLSSCLLGLQIPVLNDFLPSPYKSIYIYMENFHSSYTWFFMRVVSSLDAVVITILNWNSQITCFVFCRSLHEILQRHELTWFLLHMLLLFSH